MSRIANSNCARLPGQPFFARNFAILFNCFHFKIPFHFIWITRRLNLGSWHIRRMKICFIYLFSSIYRKSSGNRIEMTTEQARIIVNATRPVKGSGITVAAPQNLKLSAWHSPKYSVSRAKHIWFISIHRTLQPGQACSLSFLVTAIGPDELKHPFGNYRKSFVHVDRFFSWEPVVLANF